MIGQAMGKYCSLYRDPGYLASLRHETVMAVVHRLSAIISSFEVAVHLWTGDPPPGAGSSRFEQWFNPISRRHVNESARRQMGRMDYCLMCNNINIRACCGADDDW